MAPYQDESEAEIKLKTVNLGDNGVMDDSEMEDGMDLEVTKVDKYDVDKTTQYLAVIIVTIGAFSSGTFLSWTSSALPLLQSDAAHIKVTGHEGSWIASLLNLGALAGAIPTGLIAERFGRKKTLLCLALPMTMSWLLTALSTSVYCFYVGRFVGGIAVGAVSVAVPPYVLELAQPAQRATLANFYQLQLAAGLLFGYLAGMTGNVSILSLILIIVPAVYFLAFLFMPESPVYLMTQGKETEARNALYYIRGIGCDIDLELKMIKDYIKESTSNEGRFKDLIATKSNVKALFIAFCLMTLQQFSGISAIIFYLGKIFHSTGTSVSPELAAVIVGIMQLVSTYFSAAFFNNTGRKLMLIVSNVMMGISVAILGVFFHLHVTMVTEGHTWIPIVCLSVFVSFYSIGVGPIPWLMLREIFPSNIKRRATAISAGVNWFMAFMVTKYYQNMVDAIGTGWVLWNFGVACGLASLFVYFVVPETKGKTLEQIQKELNGTNKKRRHRHIIEIDSLSLSSM